MARGLKLSDRLKRQNAFVEERFGDRSICSRCGATLATFADACTADLDDACPGFLAVDKAKVDFNTEAQP